ncbi:MAG: hypothetical protein PHY09_06605 [Desulfuromonadaceae bacterium]|nr:hypothetical protein [Desulfuromonadaceae bacterium]MDD5104118.1 hypothetical protein [Desulfuromonadaceae bacterium]
MRRMLITITLFFGFAVTAQAGDRVVIGVSPALSATLSIIAKQHGFFSQQNVDADVRVVTSGSKAVEMMLKDELDISESTVFALVTNSFSRADYKILTQVSTADNR